jgi:hypothetical protein
MKLTPITTKEITDIINSLTWKNSEGYDESPLKILKVSIPFIVSPLTYMCMSPMHLEHYQISPIFKTGNKTNVKLQAIIFTHIIFQSFQGVIHNRLQFHIRSNNTLGLEQYSFQNQFLN